jgi:hypothetical protein
MSVIHTMYISFWQKCETCQAFNPKKCETRWNLYCFVKFQRKIHFKRKESFVNDVHNLGKSLWDFVTPSCPRIFCVTREIKIFSFFKVWQMQIILDPREDEEQLLKKLGSNSKKYSYESSSPVLFKQCSATH